DRTDLENWMALYTDDGTYWMPVRENQTDPLNEISILYENRTLMAVRCNNFGHRLAPSMEYPVRCNHIVSNIRIAEEDQTQGTLTVTSKFQAVVYYREQTLYAGRYTHKLQRVSDGYQIQQKRVDLINCDAPHKSLLIYL
ncbi:MAG: benzoate/toluate 1,2-dioxygenase beta subunit, partial [Cryomorphaceae bacterium]